MRFNTIDIGITEYKKIFDLQKSLVQNRLLGLIPDTIILTEHYPVFTIGRSGSKDNLLIDEEILKDMNIEVLEIDRGGDITFHGPGQLVLYPILDLKTKSKDIHLYIRRLEEVMIDFLLQYNIIGVRIPGATGVWIDKVTKIGSIGIGISKWITYHGLSININTPLYYFDMIRPCGLQNCRVTSLCSILKMDIDIKEAKRDLLTSFKRIFKGDVLHDISFSTLDKEKNCSI